MKIFIITYPESKTIDKCVNRYKEFGYDPIIFMGKSVVKDYIPSNTICFINMIDLLDTIDMSEDICISEDDVWLNEKIEIEKPNDINWLGYWNVTKSFIMGAMLIYYPKDCLPHIKRQFNSKIPQHLDRFIFKYFEYILRDKPICLEIPHESIILEQYSKGKKSIRNHKYVLASIMEED